MSSYLQLELRISEADDSRGRSFLQLGRRAKDLNLGGVDFDVAPKFVNFDSPAPETAEDVLVKYVEFSREKEPRSPYGDYQRAKALATITSSQANSGVEFSLEEYARLTLGL